MNRVLAIYLSRLISTDLDVPSYISEKIEHHLINDNFDEVETYIRVKIYEEHKKGNLVKRKE